MKKWFEDIKDDMLKHTHIDDHQPRIKNYNTHLKEKNCFENMISDIESDISSMIDW